MHSNPDVIAVPCIHCGYPGTPSTDPLQAVELYITHLVDQHWKMLELIRKRVAKIRTTETYGQPPSEESEKGGHWEWRPLTRVGEKGAKFAMIYECKCGCGETFQPEDELRETKEQ